MHNIVSARGSKMAECHTDPCESGYIKLLFEYRESKRCLCVNRSNVCETIEKELSRFGQTVSKVSLSGDCGSSNSLLLQKWSTAWDTYVDVETVDDLDDKDRVTVVRLSAGTTTQSSSKVYIM